MKEEIIKTPEEMKGFAAKLAKKAKIGDVFCLVGDLGAGKTTFAQGFIGAIQEGSEMITSPTFNLVQIYKAKKFSIYHCDFYRINEEKELANLGLDDAFHNAVSLIEWPEIGRNFLPRDSKYIYIETQKDGSRKVVTSVSG